MAHACRRDAAWRRPHNCPICFGLRAVPETFGTWGQATKEIIEQIGKKIADTIGESRSLSFVRQRINIEIQRGKAISVLETFKSSKGLDEVFYVLRST